METISLAACIGGVLNIVTVEVTIGHNVGTTTIATTKVLRT